MNTKLLIDAIVHQTTVLIAQLSTAAGIRAPLAHIADQVFLELSKEIEAQGISRKVAADMFGLAIRTYQKKVQRVMGSVTVRDRTLWQAVIERLQMSGSMARRQILRHFERDDPVLVGSVLSDLVSSGLVYRTGSGESAIFGLTKERDLAQAVREQRGESLLHIVWVVVYRAPGITRDGLRKQLAVEDAALDEALQTLVSQGELQVTGEGTAAEYRASSFLVPVGAEHGWEAAVLDHYQAVVRAIGGKVRRGTTHSAADDVVGGATLSFDVHAGHPYRAEVLNLLKHVRAEVNELWTKVEAYNSANQLPDEKEEVSFYFGQYLVSPDDDVG